MLSGLKSTLIYGGKTFEFSSRMDNSLPTVRDINHKYTAAGRIKGII